ncbi:Alpha-(1,3)-fucosyltransferase 6 [Armadillidium vulgare]|nr:Alpha-(1,3)-fucosyltransferase 6 [Armadillidium vulgare]
MVIRFKRMYLWTLLIVILFIYYEKEFGTGSNNLKNFSDNNQNINSIFKENGFISYPRNSYYVWNKEYLKANGYWNFRNFTSEEMKKLSIMGRRLFFHEDIGLPQPTTFLIYIYKFGPRLNLRLVNHYSQQNLDPFENCSVKNCRISYDHSDFNSADAVLFHLHLIEGPPVELQRVNYNQRWVWLSDESVFNTFYIAKDKNLNHYNNFFNWSMTYRSESDVPVPYGRVVPLLDRNVKLDLDVFSRKNKTLAILGSNCSGRNGRWNYVKILEKYINIDSYGHCGKLKCPGHFNNDCNLINPYKFYLAFENSNCKDYITEKAWWNSFEKETVPVVMGTTKSNYEKLLPPNSFIHVDDFESPKHLADYIR